MHTCICIYFYKIDKDKLRKICIFVAEMYENAKNTIFFSFHSNLDFDRLPNFFFIIFLCNQGVTELYYIVRKKQSGFLLKRF